MKYKLKEFLSRYMEDVEELELIKVIEQFGLSESGPWLCGGAIRRTLAKQELDSDFDFFFATAIQLEDFKTRVQKMGMTEVSATEHNITYVDGQGKKYQAITIAMYPSIETVLDSFDFTICQFGTDGEMLYCGEFSLWDLARRRLALHKLTFGVSTVRRLIKYTRQGFTACGGVLADILERTVQQPDTINRSIQYVD